VTVRQVPSIAVIGAGITGLVAARRLRDHAEVTVLEQAGRVGGQLDSVNVASRSVDVGAEAVFTAAPGLLELIAELGLSDQVVPAAPVPAGSGRVEDCVRCPRVSPRPDRPGWHR